MADIFDPCRQRGVNNSIQLKNSGLTIFHQISQLKAQGLEVPEIRQKLSENDLNGVPKPDQTGLEERGLGELKQLYEKLDQERQRAIEEKEKRIEAETRLRVFYTEIKTLTDGETIEQAKINRENRRLRRAEIIGQLKTLRFRKKDKRKRLLEELKSLDESYPQQPTKEEGASINPSSVGLARWLFIIVAMVAMVLGVFSPPIDEGKRQSQPVVEKLVVSKVMFPSMPEKHLDLGSESSPSSVRGKETERFLNPIILQAAKRYQVDPALIKAMIMAESGYNPKAISNRGAKGLMQLMPRTAEELGVEDSFNPEHNINGGVRYFKQLLNQFDGDVKLALAAYNAGSTNVRQYKDVPPFKATQNFIKKVFEYYQYYKQ